MEVIAITRNARMSAAKGRPLARACQGLTAAEALKIVEFSPKKAAEIIRKTLLSAVANAKNNNGIADAEADRINFRSHYLLSFLASVRTTLQWHMRRAIGCADPRAVGQ